MNKKEKRDMLLRTDILAGMDCYIANLNNKEIIEVWESLGIPTDCDEDKLMDIAKNEQEFNRISLVFGKIINDQL